MDRSRYTPEPEFELPFEPRQRDWAEWIYDHRTGLLITLCICLILGIGVLTGRLSLEKEPPVSAFYVEAEDLQELIAERERLERLVQQEQQFQRQMEQEYERIRNSASNVAGELDAELQAMNAEVQGRVQAAGEAYEQGLRSASEILNERPSDGPDESGAEQAGLQKGGVTVSYYFPSGRSHRAGRLPVPSYQCEGGGTVVVEVEADAGGRITRAVAARGADPCLAQYAERAARASQFASGSREPGTITYTFVAQ